MSGAQRAIVVLFIVGAAWRSLPVFYGTAKSEPSGAAGVVGLLMRYALLLWLHYEAGTFSTIVGVPR